MIILAVDDEQLGLEALTKAITKSVEGAEVAGFSSAKEALAFAKNNEVVAACLDIQMPEMLGTELAKKLKAINPAIYIVFATGYDSYMGDAFSLHASGYILKPITPAKVRKEFENIKSLGEAYIKQSQAQNKGLRFQCFGNFEAFYGQEPIHFKYDKTKELLAFLVSKRGALCSNEQIVCNIFEDDGDHESYLRGLRKDLVDSFMALGLKDAVQVQRGKMGIITEGVACDFYDYLKGDPGAINSYRGEFMYQYSWAEYMNMDLLDS